MLKRISRLIGFALLALAGYHLLFFTAASLGEVWSKAHFTSLQIFQPAVERYISVWLWENVVVKILLLPAWLPAAVLGAIFTYLGVRKNV
jgi:hypothetical protein